MPSEGGFGARLRRLGLALVNATLLLIVLALVLAVILAAQVRGIARDGRAALQAEILRLETRLEETRAAASAALEALEARPASPGAIRPEPAPGDVQALREQLAGLLSAIEGLEPPATPVAEDEAILRQLVFAIFRFVLGRMIEGEPAAPRATP